MNLTDLITLAKAGYTPKQVKELLEYVETSPEVKKTSVDEIKDKNDNEGTDNKEQTEKEDPLKIFEKLLEE